MEELNKEEMINEGGACRNNEWVSSIQKNARSSTKHMLCLDVPNNVDPDSIIIEAVFWYDSVFGKGSQWVKERLIYGKGFTNHTYNSGKVHIAWAYGPGGIRIQSKTGNILLVRISYSTFGGINGANGINLYGGRNYRNAPTPHNIDIYWK